MTIKSYIVFRILISLCILAILVMSSLYYSKRIEGDIFGISSGIIAVLSSVFAIFASKPIAKEDVSGLADKLFLTYDKEVFEKVQTLKKEEEQVRDFIEHKSNEIYLLKLRGYLKEQIENRYENSEISKLIIDLEQVENKLDEMEVQYGSLEIPERFKKMIKELRLHDQMRFYIELIDSIPIPIIFMPIKSLYEFGVRSLYSYKEIFELQKYTTTVK